MGKLNQMALEQKEKEIEQIMEQIENVRGPLHDQEALYQDAWEEWDRRNEVEIG
tara:strand:- start:106 stop:267 length:162 start_codon:yes stop_codon:yes gene_type:complete